MSESFVHPFPNGLTLLGEPCDAFESVAFHLLLSAGCCYESPSQSGLSALTCEMLLRGAGQLDSRAFLTQLENFGIERGESVGVSQASFSAAALAEHLPAAISMYADLILRPHLPADQLEAARQVCVQEVRGVEDEPSQKLMDALREQFYPSPWGRAPHGTLSGLEAATIHDIRDFYQRCYGPQSAILAIAGKFDWQQVIDLVGTHFGDWAQRPAPASDAAPVVPRVSHLPYDSTQSHIGIAFPSVPYCHPRYFEAWAAVGVLSSGMSSRLFTEVREKRGLCYTVYASLQSQRERAGVFCYAGTTAERAQETLEVTHHELVRLADGVAAEELDRLKARIKSGLIMQQESTSARSGSLARDWHHLGRVRSVEEVGAIFDRLTVADINAYLAEFPPSDFTIATLGPQPLELPSAVR